MRRAASFFKLAVIILNSKHTPNEHRDKVKGAMPALEKALQPLNENMSKQVSTFKIPKYVMSSIELDGITFNYPLNIHFFRRISLAEYCACRLHLMCSDKSEREQITKFLPIAFGYAEKLLLVELFLF